MRRCAANDHVSRCRLVLLISCHVHVLMSALRVTALYMYAACCQIDFVNYSLINAQRIGTRGPCTHIYAPHIHVAHTHETKEMCWMEHMCEPHDRGRRHLSGSWAACRPAPSAAGITAAAAASAVAATAPLTPRAVRPPGWGAIGSVRRRRRRARHHRAAGRAGTAAATCATADAGRQAG